MDQFRQIILEQREELNRLEEATWVQRERQQDLNPDSKLAQIVTGIRRCGKSTLALLAIKDRRFAYVNFDDERLAGISAGDLNSILESLYTVYGDFTCLLLDEIQNIEKWHLFVNRLLRNNIRIILTGSNSNLLSREMATHLTGRYSTIELFPYSFKEFLQAKSRSINQLHTTGERGKATHLFTEYLVHGGFPEVVSGEKPEAYTRNLFDGIVTRDIIYRYDIRHVRTFREIAMWLTTHFGKEISYNRIKNIFDLGSENTAKNYVAYLEEAWLVITLPKFSFKKQESLRYRKVYLADTSFATVMGSGHAKNEGRLLENIVFLHLLRNRSIQGYELFYYKTTFEVDFVVYHNRQVTELIQVALHLDDPKTRKREINALLYGSDQLNPQKLTLMTMNTRETIEKDGKTIQVIPVVEWLVDM